MTKKVHKDYIRPSALKMEQVIPVLQQPVRLHSDRDNTLRLWGAAYLSGAFAINFTDLSKHRQGLVTFHLSLIGYDVIVCGFNVCVQRDR